VHPTCSSYWLANSFSQFLPQDACASVDVLTLFDNLNCIALLDWFVWLHLPYCLQWVLVLAILSTSLSPCVVIVLLNCIDLYSCLVLLHCIVYLHIPLSLQWVPVYISSPHPHVCLWLYFSCRTNDLFVLTLCIITCLLPLTLTFIVDNLSASTIVEGSRPCPHPYKYLLRWGKFGVLPPIIDWLHDDSDVASVAI